MNFEPQNFFIGVIDFFSILLPGALLAYLSKDWAAKQLLGQPNFKLDSTEAWVLLLVASYLLGHFLFLIGSWLDEYVYDPIRKTTDKAQVARLLSGRSLSPKLCRWFAGLCFKARPDGSLDRVLSIKRNYLKRIEASEAVNAFQWCKAKLAVEQPAALAIVNRFEADSKFFRSFVPVLIGLLAIAVYRAVVAFPSNKRPLGFVLALTISLLLALWPYMEQRFKATQQAYWFLLTLEANQALRTSSNVPALPESRGEAKGYAVTHAGGVVFRQRSGVAEYLLVQATKDAADWVLQKGHIEPGEDEKTCAIREVKEETGVWARIKNELKVVKYPFEGQTVIAQFYVMEAVEQGKPLDPSRKREWLQLQAALDRVKKYDEAKDLLRMAEQKRTEA